MKIEAALTYGKIRHDQDKDAHLVISLTAPAKEGEIRAPICVVPVVDISGSMAGAKLDYAKRSAIKLIEHLRPGDYCGLIAFESRVHVIIPPQKITAEIKDKLKAEVGKLHTIGGTNFAGGMLKAVEMVNALDLPSGVIHRIIMLTDGQANEGPATAPKDIIKLFSANAGRVTASAFGYGNDATQDFLGDFAKECKGNYAYIRDPDGALTAFGKELGGLCSTYGTDIVLEINGLAGHSIESVVSDVDADEEEVGGEVVVRIPEILAEERRDIILAVKLKSQKQALPRPVNVFDVKLGYASIATDGKKETNSVEAKAKAHFVKQGEEDAKPIEALDKIVGLAEIIRAQIEAEEKAKKGDFTAAAAVMHNAANHVASRGYEILAAAANKTAGSVGSHAMYAADQGYLRSYRAAGTRGMGVSEIDEGAAVMLCAAGVNLSNSSQTSTSASFIADVNMVPLGTAIGAAGPVDLTGTIFPNVGGVVGPVPSMGLGGGIAGQGVSGGGLQGASWVGGHVPGDFSGASSLGAPVVQLGNPLVPQTDNSDDKLKSHAVKPGKAKSEHKVKKNKSSARW